MDSDPLLRDLLSSSSSTNSSLNFHFNLSLLHEKLSGVKFKTLEEILYESLSHSNYPFKSIILSLTVIFFILGMLGNCLLIFCILYYKFMHNSTNIFLLNLAISDLLIILFNMPWTMAYYVNHSWKYGEFLCRINPTIECLALSLSIFSLVSISFKRFLLLKNYHFQYSSKAILSWVGLIWFFSLSISSPMFMLYKLGPVHIKNTSTVLYECTHDYNSSLNKFLTPKNYTLCMFALLYVVPLLLMMLFYGKLTYSLYKVRHIIQQQSREELDSLQTNSSRLPPQENASRFHRSYNLISTYQPNNNNNEEEEEEEEDGGMAGVNSCNNNNRNINDNQNYMARRRNAVKMMLILLVIFAVCWLPYHIFNLMFYFPMTVFMANGSNSTKPLATTIDEENRLYPLTQLIAFFNTVLNPLMVIYMSRRFRQCLQLMSRRLKNRITGKRRTGDYSVHIAMRNFS